MPSKNSSSHMELGIDVMIPISIFRNREISVLEALVKYLREEHELRYSEIGKLLNRDERTVWTCYNRVKKKEASQ